MKVKVKGLVFVGFAAMIFAANAMAVDNTVTSKDYVDTKFQTIANLSQQGAETGNTLNSNSDTTYPSEKKVAAALEAVGGTVGTGTLTVNQNSVSAGTFNANATDSATISILAPDWDSSTGQQAILNKPTITNVSGDIDSAVSTDTKVVPTTYAVKQYVDGVESDLQGQIDDLEALGSSYQPVSSSVAVGNGEGNWTALAQTVSSTSDHSTAPTAKGVYDYVQSVASTIDSDMDNYQLLNQKTDDIATNATSTTAYPSTKGVADYVTAQLNDSSNVGEGNFTVSINGTAQTFNANQANNTTLTISGLEVTSNKAAAINSTNSADSTAYPSTKAVYDAIQDATGGNEIPEMANGCDSTHPCVLTNDTTDGSLVWVPIAQVGD